MIDPTASPPPDPNATTPFRSFVRRPGTMAAIGGVTLLMLTLAVFGWIGVHADVWEADWSCEASFRAPRALRQMVSVGAAASLVMMAGVSSWLGVRRPEGRAGRLLFWATIAVSWLVVIGTLSLSSYDALGCGRAL